MNLTRLFVCIFLGFSIACVVAQNSQRTSQQKNIPLSTSKNLHEPVLGAPQSTNSLPVTSALSPDGKYLALLNNGYGSAQSNYQQSIAVLDLATNQLRDFPDARLAPHARQTYFVGLAWSADGNELYASMASLTDPEGKKANSTGNGIAVYRFAGGALTADRFLKLPLVPMAHGRKNIYGSKYVPAGQIVVLSRRNCASEAFRRATRCWLPKTLLTTPC